MHMLMIMLRNIPRYQAHGWEAVLEEGRDTPHRL
jgi:hypothetical protein